MELDRIAAEGKSPLDYMLDIMRNPKVDGERRDEMAKAAAPYVHARRAPEDRQSKTVPPAYYYIHPDLESNE